MVVLHAFIAVIALGAGFWVLGAATGRLDIGFVGGMIVIGIAAASILGEGVVVQTGVEQANNTTTGVYEPLIQNSGFPLELVVMITGAMMLFNTLGEMSEL